VLPENLQIQFIVSLSLVAVFLEDKAAVL